MAAKTPSTAKASASDFDQRYIKRINRQMAALGFIIVGYHVGASHTFTIIIGGGIRSLDIVYGTARRHQATTTKGRVNTVVRCGGGARLVRMEVAMAPTEERIVCHG